jgi:Holliday junction resolvase RusA-like endonuclease
MEWQYKCHSIYIVKKYNNIYCTINNIVRLKYMDKRREKTEECPIKFNEDLIGKEFVYFDLEGEPYAKQRPRATKKGRYITIYTPRETKIYESKVSARYKDFYGSKQLNGDLTVQVDGYFGIPKSVSNKKASMMLSGEIPHTKKPDCDNMAKICLDALNGVAYPDDAIITKLIATKQYSDIAKVRITIIKN